MARKYVKNPSPPAAPKVGSTALDGARATLDDTRRQLEEAERADPALPGWDTGVAAAWLACQAAERRVAALEAAVARQVEASGKRDAAAAAAAGQMETMTAELTVSRDRVQDGAAAALRALADLAGAAGAHNALVTRHRGTLAAAGLMSDTEGVDGAVRHAEGAHPQPFGRGVRLDGTDWTMVPADGVAAHALAQVFGAGSPHHPMAALARRWRSHEVTARPDGLRLPALADAGVTVPEPPGQLHARRAPITREDGTAI